MLPAAVQRAITPHVGDVRAAQSVSGGDINSAWRIETTSGHAQHKFTLYFITGTHTTETIDTF